MRITKTAAFILNVAIFLIVNSMVSGWLQTIGENNIVLGATLGVCFIYAVYTIIKFIASYGKQN